KAQGRQKNHAAANRAFKKLLKTSQSILPKAVLLKERARAAEKAGKFPAAAEAYRELSLQGTRDSREWALSGLIRCLTKKTMIETSKKPTKHDVQAVIFQCPDCKAILPSERSETCNECGTMIPHCSVCKLPIEKEELTSTCPNCGAVSHYEHLQEWLHIRPSCPHCKVNLASVALLRTPAKAK
ncbi:MAG: hypothetical protein ACE5OZ_26310, partial [Candidatus Heimdallarchaeota archaeon]